MDLEIRLLHNADRLLALHAEEIPQKTELCGAFWGLLALLAHRNGGEAQQILDQDQVALLAGAAISEVATDEVLPPGEKGRVDYRLDLPRLADSRLTGTSATGLTRAIESLDGDLAVVPVRGPWDSGSLDRLLQVATGDAAVVSMIANLETLPLWNSRLTLPALLAYLVEGSEPEDIPADWQVGHFVGLLGSVHGPARSLLVVADTYASLGAGGIHLQPPSRFAEALQRSDGKGGGVLLVVARSAAGRLGEVLGAAGFELKTWDNGSRDVEVAR